METISYYFDKKIFKIHVIWTNNKNMYLKMDGDKVICSAPKGTSIIDVKLFVNQHATKFYEHSKNIKKNLLYSVREDFLYLFGKKFLIVRLTGLKTPRVKIMNDKIYIYAFDTSDENIEKVIKDILKKEIIKYINKRQRRFEKEMGVSSHACKFVYKTSTWGSNYVNQRRIIYSTKLAHYREAVIDYVIIHELAHHYHQNHSRDFWWFVGKFEPYYKDLRNELKADSEMKDE
ncbi:M48 family metallopeptidase [Mycoplasma marinum]|uniref:YgjP-like metallopeptidase domain-containing protein n=1 Tax=Mycoplasma marinum TaxID=1937190 RepID=A0A4R0XQY4_9MOLU|nr:YgjP-like metallopeptidase domain-containing protein [Mycoplasma marinum]TCG12010.1 hypothetical protein C4B24_00150 [Mycoplasma marinum]